MITDAAQVEHAPLPAGVDPDGVIERLFREGYRFDFFQATWLLEKLFADAPAPGTGIEPAPERIRFRPHGGVVFPASDVREVTFDEGMARVTVTFMGLYGVDAPLPGYFYNGIAAETEDSDVLRDFLDIFNHRLFAYFYRAWKKYRPGLHGSRTDRDAHVRTFLSLAGVGTPEALPDFDVPVLRLAAFAGRLGDRARNADGLRALMAGLLGGVPVEVRENLPRWVPIPAPTRIGRGGGRSGRGAAAPAVLGSNTILGRRLFDVSGKFRIVLGPMSYEQYLSYLPGTAQARTVHALVRLYAPDFLDYDVELLLDSDEVPPLRLGDRRSQVGRNAWVGHPSVDVVSDVVAYA